MAALTGNHYRYVIDNEVSIGFLGGLVGGAAGGLMIGVARLRDTPITEVRAGTRLLRATAGLLGGLAVGIAGVPAVDITSRLWLDAWERTWFDVMPSVLPPNSSLDSWYDSWWFILPTIIDRRMLGLVGGLAVVVPVAVVIIATVKLARLIVRPASVTHAASPLSLLGTDRTGALAVVSGLGTGFLAGMTAGLFFSLVEGSPDTFVTGFAVILATILTIGLDSAWGRRRSCWSGCGTRWPTRSRPR